MSGKPRSHTNRSGRSRSRNWPSTRAPTASCGSTSRLSNSSTSVSRCPGRSRYCRSSRTDVSRALVIVPLSCRAMARRATPEPSSRERLVTSATRLMARQGYAATPVQRIAAEGSAPMGSFYFHFPGGKEELGVAALRSGAEAFGRLLAGAFVDSASVVDALPACARRLADDLRASDWADGCPLGTTALEAGDPSPPPPAAAAEA